MQKMNINILLIAQLVLFAACIQSRAIEDVDNSIENAGEGDGEGQTPKQRSPFEQDWIKFAKKPPTKLLQTLGQPVEIACEVMGSQVPTIQWVVGHLPLSEIDSVESNVISESSTSAIVRVRSVHVIDHMLSEARTYTCVGRTGGKTIYSSTIVYPQADMKELVQVRDKPFPGPQKPRIVYHEKLHLDLVDSNIVLPCKVHARPRAEVFWMNGEGKLIEPNHRFKILPSGDLLLSNIKWEDMGAYRCIARNAMGKDSADTFVYPVLKEDK
ncbi:neural/ectodermal development factor IMP-L2 isoform X1 [Zeugodacus cucurbitae]|uniref:Neural/ectodermal development factor IMP-L2 n=2 Tax=Zeugodacus cucurbitae TaxID=28588 RepID=A0A0A1XL72_ZEUCU|nr:neural/ectodermal development factor IMP-L2 isoform X1 [Zeugodacus cucurbitae]